MSRRQQLEFLSTVVLAVCGVVLTGTYVWRSFASPRPADAVSRVVEIRNWKTYAVGGMQIGSAAAPVTITEFSDFECPACLRLYRAIEQVRAKYGHDVRIVYRNYPLDDLHPNARAAAIAAECASEQGRFAEYYEHLFKHQALLGQTDWVTTAATVGISDTAAFRGCLVSSAVPQRLRTDSAAAAELNITGTPLVLVNAWKNPGAPSPLALEKLVRDEIARAAKSQPR